MPDLRGEKQGGEWKCPVCLLPPSRCRNGNLSLAASTMGTLWDGEPDGVRREEMWFPVLSVLGAGKCGICLEGATGFEGNKQPENACMEGIFSQSYRICHSLAPCLGMF